MLVKPDFENLLKEIDPEFHIRYNKHDPDAEIAGIYWKEADICGIPSKDIYQERSNDHTFKDYPHRSIPEAIAKCKEFLENCKTPGFYEEYVEPI